MNTKTLRYETFAQQWNECLALGNGFLGAMISGKSNMEEIYLNEDSYWYGGYRNRNNQYAKKHLDEIRELILKEEIPKAEKLSLMALSATPQCQRHYLPSGKIDISFDLGEYKNYSRSLDLSTAVAKTEFEVGEVLFKREYFASYPSNVIAIKLSVNKQNSMNFSIRNSAQRYVEKNYCQGDDTVISTAYSGGVGGVNLVNIFKLVTDGETLGIGETISVQNATTAYIYISSATTFRHENPKEYCEKTIENAVNKGYDYLLSEHIKDYSALFSTMSLDLTSATSWETTDKLLANLDDRQTLNQLIETYFNFGRYLLISCSRKGSLPANLQGIWNKEPLPPWDSKYTININTEMNYWPAEILNLSSCHEPLFALLKRMLPNGEETAKQMYGCKGFVAHHNTDIWADTAPQDCTTGSTIWLMGAAWLCTHIIDRFEFTCDLEFAKQHFELLKKACEFILDFQFEHEGKLITCPSSSPENRYVLPNGQRTNLCYSAAMDNQIILTLFSGTISIVQKLNIEPDFAKTLKETIAKMPNPVALGKDGRVLEWQKEYKEADEGHRHISHLFALYPSNLIGDDEKLLEAAQKTIERRLANGGGHTGWSAAWIINMWARLKQTDKFYDSLRKLLENLTLSNLFDKHPPLSANSVRFKGNDPPFQIDGNFGAIAGIGEALIQSHNGYLQLLPCLPKQWQEGSVKGICARGNLILDIYWENGKLKNALVQSKNSDSTKVCIKYKNKEKIINVDSNESVMLKYCDLS